MVKIRLARGGAKKRPYYRIVVADEDFSRDGRFIEQIGTYDPFKPASEAKVAEDRVDYWVGNGAKLSETVTKLIGKRRRDLAAAASA